MITVERMINNINDMSDINNISLKLYKEFFNNVLCNRIFKYTTVDGTEITLLFNESEFMHLLGAQHILGRRYKATKFNEEIDNGNMTFQALEQRNSIQFKDDIDRFLGFSNIYHVLTSCEAIYFDKYTYKNNTVPKRNPKFDFKYILFQDLYSKKLHIGIDTYNRGKSYYGKSLLVVSDINDKYIKNQEPLYINNIKVIDKKTKTVINDINMEEVALTEDTK